MTERIFSVAHYADMTVLYLLIALSLVSVYLILERFFFLRGLTLQSKNTLKEMEVALLSRKFGVIETIAQHENSVEGRAARLALTHLESQGKEGLDQIFSTYIQVERPKFERSLGFLATVGSNAPYIGLFGTVLGIMKSFNDLSKASEAGQNTVMAGISAALIATAAGLMVAIPAVLAYNYFQKQVKTVIGNLDVIKDMAFAYHQEKEKAHGRQNFG